MKYILLLLALLAQPAPPLTAQWNADQHALRVTWSAPGWHCLRLDGASLDCRNDSADLLLPTGGVDHLYAPHAGQVLRLIDEGGKQVAQVVVPLHLTPRAWLPVTLQAPDPPPAPVWRVWLGMTRG